LGAQNDVVVLVPICTFFLVVHWYIVWHI